MARKKHAEEHENHERWLVSYADFMTLLFAFFVVMYAVSRVDSGKLQKTAESIKWALHMSGLGGTDRVPIFRETDGTGLDLGNGGANKPPGPSAVEKLRKRMEKKLGPLLLDKEMKISVIAEGSRLSVRLGASRFFDAGQSALRPEALPVLDAIVAELQPLGLPIRVEGHTDSQPPQSPRFRNNWELSASRASTVVSYLEDAHKMRPDLLSAVGHGSTVPIASDSTPEGRELNRRIEMAVELTPEEAAKATGAR
ncbi:MAG: flagellar motor protein MotB [Myxococcales bacterium]